MTGQALVAPRLFSLVRPATYSLAVRLFVLTDGRAGSSRYKPNVGTFYETSLVTSLYEHLLMDPELSHLEVRHEMAFHSTSPEIRGRRELNIVGLPVGAPRSTTVPYLRRAAQGFLDHGLKFGIA